MTPTIKCNKFNVKITGDSEVNIDLDFETQQWVVSRRVFATDRDLDPALLVKQYSDLEDAVNYARQVAGNKIV